MKTPSLVTLVLLVAACACVDPWSASTCEEDSDCPTGHRCDPESKVCRQLPETEPVDASRSDLVLDAPAPDLALLDITRPDTTAVDISAPDAAAQDTAAPDSAAPDTAMPDTAAPDTAAPDTATPDSAAPDTAAPDTAAPDTAAPDTAAPDTAAPDTAAPDICAPTCAGRCGGADDGCGGTCDGTCSSGEWCSAGSCVSCDLDDPAHCGSSCLDCVGPLPHPDGRACVNGACGCALKTDCDFGVSCTNYSCEDVGPSIGAGWHTDIGDRIDVYYTAQIDFGPQHWDWIRVFNATTGAYIGFMSAYHVDAGFSTYFGGSGQWPASWYRFHGSKEQFRQRGLPRYVKFRFIDATNAAYSSYSNDVDLGALP